jgi:hypothetical protein
MIPTAFRPLLLLFYCFLSFITLTTTTASSKDARHDDGDALADDPQLDRARAIFDWVRSVEGTIVNPKQEVRRVVRGDVTSPIGVFATDVILPGEVLLRIPGTLTVGPDDYADRGHLHCEAVTNLAREMRLGDQSTLAPFVEYLSRVPIEGQLPSGWSDAGRTVLHRYVLDDPVDTGETRIPPAGPVDWIRDYVKEECGVDDPLSIKAGFLIVARSDDSVLVPAYVSGTTPLLR